MSRATPPHVTIAIRDAITTLSSPLTAGDLAENWTGEARATFLSWMEGLLARAPRGETVRSECKSIIRNLDVWGIQDGRVHDAVLGVQDAWLRK